jgi:hypothetical protein
MNGFYSFRFDNTFYICTENLNQQKFSSAYEDIKLTNFLK